MATVSHTTLLVDSLDYKIIISFISYVFENEIFVKLNFVYFSELEFLLRRT